MIKLEHVKKSFGDQAILRDISLNVPTGSVTVILGPSGSGKTTLLRTINFLGKADGGTLFINDQRYDLRKASGTAFRWSAAARRHRPRSGGQSAGHPVR